MDGVPLTPIGQRQSRAGACSFEGCGRPIQAKRLCPAHYMQHAQGRELTPIVTPKPKGVPCEVDDCGRRSVTDGLCRTHYGWRLAGDPDWARPIRSKAPHGAGHTDPNGYRFVTVNGRKVAEHKVVMEQVLGRPMIRGESVHHKHGQRDDNRPEQLELWSTAQPSGQRVYDKLVWAMELLELYETDPPEVTGLSVEGQLAWHRDRIAALGGLS
jgi:hypothetical protein